MATHDLRRLSSLDFEELVHDLLEAKWNVSLEAFTSGTDGGIDLRHVSHADSQTIVQCKHFQESGFTKLLTHLLNVELPKVVKLNPGRYVLVTSVGLTPHRKDQILAAMAPYVKTTDDIIGASEVEAWLRAYPNVEQTHYKLWLTSTAVLQRVLHSAERCQTDFQIDRIRRKLPLFVQNKAYPRALKVLEDARVVVIAGAPGIGKSTLAEMLIYAHLDKGYEPVVIQADVAEGRKLYRPDRKQIFYFDDFLGQTYLGDRPEYLGRNQDSALSAFIEMVQHSENARFILTTRDHILGGALQRSERLTHSGLIDRRCVLELADYRRSQKARILFNHLYFSDLPPPYKEAVLANDFFLTIVDHDNFNPRVIEWLSTFGRVKEVVPEKYQAHVKQLLDEPERIWSHAFEGQISHAAKNILVATYSAGFSNELIDIKPAWEALHAHSAKRYGYATDPADFRRGLKELEGAFLNLRNNHVSFLNPSVRDFLAAMLAQSPERVRDIVESAIRFRQVGGLWHLADTPKFAQIREYLLSDQKLLFGSLYRLLHAPATRWRQEGRGLIGTPIDYSVTERVKLVIDIAEHIKTQEALTFVRAANDALHEEWKHTWWGMAAALDVLKNLRTAMWVYDQVGEEMDRRLIAEMVANFDRARSEDWIELLKTRGDDFWPETAETALEEAFQRYRSRGVDDERFDCNTVSEMEELKDNLEKLHDRFDVDFRYEIESLEERIAEKSKPEPDDEGAPVQWSPPDDFEFPADDDEIRSMFGSLLA